MPAWTGLRLGLADEGQIRIYEELLTSIERAAADLGVGIERVRRAAEERRVDVLLFIGRPYRFRRLLSGAKASHRVCWYGENLPIAAPSRGQRLHSHVPRRASLAIVRAARALPGGDVSASAAAWRERTVIDRELLFNLRELARARRSGLFDEVVVTSPNRVAGAALAGWASRTIPFGYHERLGGPLRDPSAERDIPLVMFGRASAATPARLRMLDALVERLGPDLSLHVVESGLYGAERHEVLARTRIVLHLHRVPHLSSALRYVLATAAGAAFAGEATDDEWLPGRLRYVVEADLVDLADRITELADDEVRRARLVAAGQDLLRTDWSMSNTLTRLLDGLAIAAPTATRA